MIQWTNPHFFVWKAPTPLMTTSPGRSLRHYAITASAGVGALALLAAGAVTASAVTYPVTASQIGLSETDAWTASAAGVAAVVLDPDRDEVLQLTKVDGVDSNVMHHLANRNYPWIDGALAAELSWDVLFNGSTGDPVDPISGNVIEAAGNATARVQVSEGATLFVDMQIAHGNSPGSLGTAYVTCELSGETAWTLISLDDCNIPDESMETGWIVTESWTFKDPYWPEHTYAPGDRFNPMYGVPPIAAPAGFGFHIEGPAGATARITDLTVLDHTIDFVAAATTSSISATTVGPAVPGVEVTLTATVSPSSAVGTFAIFDGVTKIGEDAAVDGAFVIKTSALDVGAHSLTAVFTPADLASYSASTSPVVTFSLNEKKSTPAAPPAASSDALAADILSGLDVEETTDSFVPSGGPSNPLGSFDSSQSLSGELPWSDGTDSFVDVYAYSSPVFLGTFPIVNGHVQLNGLDLSGLSAKGHHLVFIGQTSGGIAVMAVYLVAGLAATGADVALPLGSAALLLLIGAALLVTARRARTASHRS